MFVQTLHSAALEGTCVNNSHIHLSIKVPSPKLQITNYLSQNQQGIVVEHSAESSLPGREAYPITD